MPDIVLATLNARYSHASFGLRYLLANLGDLAGRTAMMEFEIKHRPEDVAAKLLAGNPRILALGVYIWNVAQTTEIVRRIKAARPEVVVVVGGPEVSHEIDEQEICRLADYVVTDEADVTFPALCRDILEGNAPRDRIIRSLPVDVRKLALPYRLYGDEDVANRVIYVEASRGCPFTCEFCLSSLDVPLRRFPLETLLPEFQSLLDRGVRQFKFVDRTFNLSIAYSLKLLEFFLERYTPGLFLHFEMIPDRLPEELRDIIRAFPPGSLQFEVGIQTFNDKVAERIKRRQDYAKTEDNLRFLLGETKSHIHADLIFGLPGETLESFGAGFDRLVAIGPQEIQVNQLKRLRGTPIVRHDTEWGVVWSREAPYEIIRNKDIDEATMQRLRRFGRFWDLLANSGNFLETAPLLRRDAGSAFARYMEVSDALFDRFQRTHGIALESLAEALFDLLTTRFGVPQAEAATALANDLTRGGRRDAPKFLRPFVGYQRQTPVPRARTSPKRQARHISSAGLIPGAEPAT